MRKLGKRNYELIGRSMKTLGFNHYTDGLMCEEEMYVDEIEEIIEFLKWLKEVDRPFGQINYEQRFAEFKSGEKAPELYYEVFVRFPNQEVQGFTMGGHVHTKRISADHEDLLQIAARLCTNLDDPDMIMVKSNDAVYLKYYDIAEMKAFVEENQEAINEVRQEGYSTFPSEFF